MEMYTWESLGTFAGATGATLLVVQYLKMPMDKVWKFPTRFLVLGVAFLVLIGGKAMGGAGVQWADLPLIVVNAFLVALSAMGAYENTFAEQKKPDQEQKPHPPA